MLDEAHESTTVPPPGSGVQSCAGVARGTRGLVRTDDGDQPALAPRRRARRGRAGRDRLLAGQPAGDTTDPDAASPAGSSPDAAPAPTTGPTPATSEHPLAARTRAPAPLPAAVPVPVPVPRYQPTASGVLDRLHLAGQHPTRLGDRQPPGPAPHRGRPGHLYRPDHGRGPRHPVRHHLAGRYPLLPAHHRALRHRGGHRSQPGTPRRRGTPRGASSASGWRPRRSTSCSCRFSRSRPLSARPRPAGVSTGRPCCTSARSPSRVRCRRWRPRCRAARPGRPRSRPSSRRREWRSSGCGRR